MMSRATLLAIVLVSLALAAVVGTAARMIRRDRTTLEESFADELLREIQQIARETDNDLSDVVDGLRVASEVVTRVADERACRQALSALLDTIPSYRLVRVYSRGGELAFTVADRSSTPDPLPGMLERLLTEVLEEARHSGPDQVSVSQPPSEDADSGFRAFATSLAGDRGFVTLLVDTKTLFDRVRSSGAGEAREMLLLGPHGHPATGSSPKLKVDVARVRTEAGALPTFASLVEAMKAGGSGTAQIPDQESLRLGFGGDGLVVAYAPVPVAGGRDWSIASFSSTANLRVHQRRLVLRVGLTSLAVAIALVAAGAFLVLSSIQGAALRERLARATDLVQLNEISQRILDHVPVGVVALAGDGRILALNRDIRVRAPEAQAGMRLDRGFASASEAARSKIDHLVAEARRTHQVQYLHAEHLDLFGRAGRFSVHAIPLDEPLLIGVRTLLVIEDVTALERLSSQLVRAEKLATVGVLAAGIAHELGTPLSVVRGRSEYLQHKLGADHPQAAVAAVIIEQIDRVSRTIRDLLDFARVRPAVVAPVDVEKTARRVEDLLHFESERRGIGIEIRCEPGVPMVAADADQLEQLLANLLLNAFDACVEGQVVRVELHRTAVDGLARDGEVRLEVIDPGSGMNGEQLHRAFDPFYTTKKRGQGTGLGLTIVEQIVRNHGARIELASVVGSGTRVVIHWPTAGGAGRDGFAGTEVEAHVG